MIQGEAVNRLATKVFEDIKTTIKNPLVLQGKFH
jgi:hypothetical protein